MLILLLSVVPYFNVVLGSIFPSEAVERAPRQLELSSNFFNKTSEPLSIDTPWEKFLVAAPAAVSVLGQISALGGKKDFRLDEVLPNNGFKYMRNPSSFNATMAQLRLDSWNSFHIAHRNMEAIHLNMTLIPSQVKTVVQVLEKSSESKLQQMLKIPFKNITEIGQFCVDKAREAQDEFVKIYNTLCEIVMTTQISRGANDERLINATMNEEVTTTLIKRVQDRQAPRSIDESFESGFLFDQMEIFAEVINDLQGAVANSSREMRTFVAKLSPIKSTLPRTLDGPTFPLFTALLDQGQAIATQVVRLTRGVHNELKGTAKEEIEFQLQNLRLQLDTLLRTSATSGNQSAHGRFNVTQAANLSKFHHARQEALVELQERQARADLERARFQEITELIKQSLEVFQQIQYQWNLLTQFFTAMDTRTEFSFNQTTIPFIKTVTHLALNGPILFPSEQHEYLLRHLSPIVEDVQITAHFLQAVSKTYVEISANHILDPLSSMADLSALPAGQRAGAIAELQRRTKVSEDEIFHSVKATRETFIEAIQSGRFIGD